MQDLLMPIAAHPFTWGLIVGLMVAVFNWKDGMTQKKFLKEEIKKMKAELESTNEHLNRQMKINAKGLETMQQETADLRQQNSNLKELVSELKQKPGSRERRAIAVFEKAIRVMSENAPGFVSAWEKCYREAEAEMEKNETGMTRFVSRIVNPLMGTAANLLHNSTEEKPAREPQKEVGKDSSASSDTPTPSTPVGTKLF